MKQQMGSRRAGYLAGANLAGVDTPFRLEVKLRAA